MKYTIDTVNKEITIKEEVNLMELFNELNDRFDYSELQEYKLKVETKIETVPANPYPYPITPWNPFKIHTKLHQFL